MVILGLTFFAIFGVIAGGLVIQIIAPLLLILGGVALYRASRDTALTDFLRGKRPPATVHNGAPRQNGLVEALSPREIEVLQLVDAGMANQDIAARLSIAPSTVKTHINNIYGKLGVETRVQAINRARALGLLDETR